MSLPRLLLLTDRSQLPLGRSLVATLRDCVAAGATTVVVRELDLPEPQRAALVREVVTLGATVISAHTLLLGAAGVHLPATTACNAELPVPRHSSDDMADPVTPLYLVGRSCHSAEEVRRAAAAGAAYATLSPYAASASKPGYGPQLSSGAFADHGIPVYALGGITVDNPGRALATGAHGVAVMGEVMRSRDPGRTVARLLAEVGG